MQLTRWFAALLLAVAIGRADERGSFATTALPHVGAADAAVKDLLALYATPAGRADYTMTAVPTNTPVFEVSFPSPFASPHPANNIVWARYYAAATPGKHPAVVMLHHAEGANMLEDFVSRKLAGDGVPTLLVQLPYYGKRRPKNIDPEQMKRDEDLEHALPILRQGVLDIHRAKDWLRSRPEVDPQRVSVAGISLGAFAAALAAGVDPDFHRVALLLGGGDIVGVLTSDLPGMKRSRDEMLKRAGSVDELREKLRSVEPLTFAYRIPHGISMMVNAKLDDHIPVECTLKLWRALGEPTIHWYDSTHVGVAIYLLDIADVTSAFLGGQFEGSSLTSALEALSKKKERK